MRWKTSGGREVKEGERDIKEIVERNNPMLGPLRNTCAYNTNPPSA